MTPTQTELESPRASAEHGQTTAEYALIASTMTVFTITLFMVLSEEIWGAMDRVIGILPGVD